MSEPLTREQIERWRECLLITTQRGKIDGIPATDLRKFIATIDALRKERDEWMWKACPAGDPIASLREENERLRRATTDLLAHWDGKLIGGPERFVPENDVCIGYWSPHAAMVESKFVNALRRALLSETKP